MTPMTSFRRSAKVYTPRRGQKQTVLSAIRDLPNFLRLLYGLMTDRRVEPLDKALVGAAIAYVLMPFDFIPDIVGFFGQVDDIFLLVLALRRLMNNAGRRVLLDHWMGDPEDLADLRLERVLAAAAFFLPGRISQRLRRLAGVNRLGRFRRV
jgi:uncharacterized membrane protein YkvA (DUF1232 family)